MFWLIIAGCLFLDQFTKYLVVTHMTLGQSIPVIENVFHITYVINKGASFSLLQGQQWFFIVLTLVVVIVVLVLLRYIPKQNKLLRYAIAVFLGGTLGNFIDRVHQGAVIDFFDIRIFPIWNIADSFLVISLIVICVI
ncbi:MAG: signal peptidase II [Clostridiales bacterium]